MDTQTWSPLSSRSLALYVLTLPSEEKGLAKLIAMPLSTEIVGDNDLGCFYFHVLKAHSCQEKAKTVLTGILVKYRFLYLFWRNILHGPNCLPYA